MSLNKIINLFLTKFLPQRKNSSVLSHEFHNYNTLTVDKLRLAFKKHRNQKFRKNISFIKRKKLNNLAIDIGSGTGINTIYLAKYFKKIIAVEPSKSASIISRKYFSKYKNFFWINEYAEDFLNKIKPKKKTFFQTFHVLSHLDNKTVEKILFELNSNKIRIGSALCFDELFSNKPVSKFTFYVRTKLFWSKNLSNWDLNFSKKKVKGLKKLNANERKIYRFFEGIKKK